jgi:hypothetical protein
MRAKTIFLLLFLAATLLQGCITSLHPLYMDKDLVYDKRLEGLWNTEETGETWDLRNLMEKELEPYKDSAERSRQKIFKNQVHSPRTYLLTYTEKGRSAEFNAHLITLDGQLFMDIFPRSPRGTNSLLEDHYLPVHTYAKVILTAAKVELYFFNAELLYKLMDENRIRLKHESFEYYKVITASTEELQQFVIKFGSKKDFFEKPLILKK